MRLTNILDCLSPLLTPSMCLQAPFDSCSMGVQAVNTQEANKAASNRLPPLWAMVAMVLLGWNEAMSILTSPVRLVSVCVGSEKGRSWPVSRHHVATMQQ